MKNKIGLLFGSFNPVHIGHMIVAGYMHQFTDLDEVWFVVSPENPLKDKRQLLAGQQCLGQVVTTADQVRVDRQRQADHGADGAGQGNTRQQGQDDEVPERPAANDGPIEIMQGAWQPPGVSVRSISTPAVPYPK